VLRGYAFDPSLATQAVVPMFGAARVVPLGRGIPFGKLCLKKILNVALPPSHYMEVQFRKDVVFFRTKIRS
jgi:hypothetical protein